MCKKKGIYGFLGPSWVLITILPRNTALSLVSTLDSDQTRRQLTAATRKKKNRGRKQKKRELEHSKAKAIITYFCIICVYV